MARLDKLSLVKLVAQIASTLGREFQYELLRHVALLDESQLRRSLTQLVDSEILFQQGVPPQASYTFKHALIQEAAYGSLLKSNRQLYHGRIVGVLEKDYPELVATEPEILAHHCSEAGMAPEAIGYWLAAGQQAFARSANKEAVSQLERGLKLLPRLEKTAALQMELPLQVTRGMALICIKGYSSDDVEQAFARAREICTEMDGTPQIAPVIWGLWAFYIVRGEFRKAIETGNELNSLAEMSGDADLILECQPVLGHNYYWTGDFVNAEEHFRRGVELYSPNRRRSRAAAFGQDPGVVSMAYEGWLLWQMGDVERAVKMSLDAIALAKQIPHVYSEAYATVFAGVLYMMMHDPKQCLELARRSASLADEYGFPIWGADSLMLSGWAKAQMGSPDEGIAELSRGIASWKAIGARLWLTQPLGLLAEIYGRTGDFDEAFSRLSEAFALMENTGEKHFHSELLRIKGMLLLQRNTKDDAEGCFRRAVTIAHYANAKMFELNARIELVKLLEGTSKSDSEKRELADLYKSVPHAAKQLKEAVESITTTNST